MRNDAAHLSMHAVSPPLKTAKGATPKPLKPFFEYPNVTGTLSTAYFKPSPAPQVLLTAANLTEAGQQRI
jgi:hypothetical protein